MSNPAIDRLIEDLEKLSGQLEKSAGGSKQETNHAAGLMERCIGQLRQQQFLLEEQTSTLENLQRTQKATQDTLRDTHRELERKIDEISLVRLVAEVGIRSLLSDRPLQFILDQITEITAAQTGSIMLLDSQKGNLYVAASVGKDVVPPYERSYRLGEGLAKWVEVGTRESGGMDPKDEEMLKETSEEFGCILCYPLLVESKLVGVLSIGQNDRDGFDQETERILFIIASQVALAVYNAQLIDQPEGFGQQRTRAGTPRKIGRHKSDPSDTENLEESRDESEESGFTRFRIRELVENLRTRYRSKLRQKKIRMRLELPKRIPAIKGQPTALNRAIDLLVESSLNQTPQHGEIKIQMLLEGSEASWTEEHPPSTKTEKYVHFIIEDTSPPLTPTLMENFWDHQIKSPLLLSSQAKGDHPGLITVKKIIEHHGGSCWPAQASWHGHAMHFTLPMLP